MTVFARRNDLFPADGEAPSSPAGEAPGPGAKQRWSFAPVFDLLALDIAGYSLRGRPAEGRAGGDAAALFLRAAPFFPPGARRGLFFLHGSGPPDPSAAQALDDCAAGEGGLSASRIAWVLDAAADRGGETSGGDGPGPLRDRGFLDGRSGFGGPAFPVRSLFPRPPAFLFLDPFLVRGVHQAVARQHYVRALAAFADEAESRVVAPAVTAWPELEVLARLGVRYAEGPLAGPGGPVPWGLRPGFQDEAAGRIASARSGEGPAEESIADLLTRPRTVRRSRVTCRDMDRLFQRDPGADHVVVVEAGAPLGIVTRQHFYRVTGGPFGYSLFQRRPVEDVLKSEPLMVEQNVPVIDLARMAMGRRSEDVYDPVVVLDARGRLAGSVTVKQLLRKASDLEVSTAMGSSPLTNLPGNRTLHRWIERLLAAPSFSVLYADLDRFKEYNDAHGFVQGDEMIRLAARVLSGHLDRLGSRARLGHVGGDDFVVLGEDPFPDGALADLCRDFDERRLALFREEDRRRGWYESADRAGRSSRAPLVTLSLAVLESVNFLYPPRAAHLTAAAASLKKRVKRLTAERGASAFLRERRTYRSEAEL